MEELVTGMPVADADGLLGTLASVERNAQGTITQLVVQRRTSSGVFTPEQLAVVNGVLRLDADAAMTEAGTLPEAGMDVTDLSAQHQVVDFAPGEELRIPVLRETAVVHTRQVNRGGVRVHKTVTSREERVELPLVREDVTVERISIDQVVDVAPQSRQEGDTLILPIVEERTFIGTHLILVEEVRITRHRTQTSQQVAVELREEHVDIEKLDAAGDL